MWVRRVHQLQKKFNNFKGLVRTAHPTLRQPDH
ncbi:Uncharacterised protein [Alysiella crassa]|uniref:Uncharacterized protein n=1 Tax=Alysiella crassa TaxID=153491 RepID=A0A376BMP4_9NEIS|nr:Uncharacterised protein [Alysiella crassa]